MQHKYYQAYDDRYRQIHSLNLCWFNQSPSAIVSDIIDEFSVTQNQKILEIGCGEGRDAFELIRRGYDLLATDVSPTAIKFCESQMPYQKERFQILDCLLDSILSKFDFIYAVAVVHMLVPDSDRNTFYQFIYEHLNEEGIALICSMGDGTNRMQTDIDTAFDLKDRIHEASGISVMIANTSCRIVDFETFRDEIQRNQLEIVKQGTTSVAPDFPEMIYAVVRKARPAADDKTF